MPVEIQELIVRVVVEPEQGRPAPTRTDGGMPDEQLIERVVEQVLRILREREER